MFPFLSAVALTEMLSAFVIALGCGICFMLSGHHGLYSSQTFVTNKLRSEYMSHKWRVKVKKAEE